MRKISYLAIGIIFIIIMALIFANIVPYVMEIVFNAIANLVID